MEEQVKEEKRRLEEEVKVWEEKRAKEEEFRGRKRNIEEVEKK